MADFHTDQPAFEFHPGTAPLLVSMPHVGTHVPDGVRARLTDEAQQVPDTDWHLERLYDFVRSMGASILVATHSRYVVDLNRPPDGSSLYPGQSVTGLCPVDTFDDTPLYRDPSLVPDDAEIALRREAIWKPYHTKLGETLDAMRAQHGVALLWDAHSIRSVLPRFFEGKLPDLNLGTGKGSSCSEAMAQAVLQAAQPVGDEPYTSVLNGRFTGGYITRNYGRPEQNIHAIQLEMTQSSYMQEALPFDYLPERAEAVQPVLERMVTAAMTTIGRQC